ncbi:hypothetical protein ACWIID_32565 [Streptomyces phaeochromogenes]
METTGHGTGEGHAATSGSMMANVHAYLGSACTGSSDDGRERFVSTPISPVYAKETLRLQEEAATETDLHPVVVEAITESYFTEWGTRADGLRADLTDVQSTDFQF